MNKKIINKLFEPKPVIHITKPRYPSYALQIFTGIITLLLFQIIMYNFMRNIPVALGEKVATFLCLLIFVFISAYNFNDENNNRSV